jgi:cellulose synthase (UDP-forming)
MKSVSDLSPSPGASPSRNHRYRDRELTSKARRNFVFFVFTVISAVIYLGWAFYHANYTFWYAVIPYLIAELICFGSLLLWSEMMMRRREHAPSGLPLPAPPDPVDVIITCCGEPLRVLEPTLRAAAKIDYPDYQVTVADDRDDPAVKALCGELGFTYLTRPTHENRKAGNLNYAYTRTSAPFLLVLDADQIPHDTILDVLMGYFTVPKIGFVTTYQAFDVPPGDPWSNRDRVFYGAMQTSRNATNSAISCGSGVVYRRAALEQIGGFATWNLVEDVYSSLLMHAKGWKSVYHHFPVTHGTAPIEVTGHVRQRWQWAVDSLRLLFWKCPLFTKGLTWRQRLNYVSFGYNYLLFGIAYPIFFLLPAWGLFSEHFFMRTSATDFILWRLPYFIFFFIFNRLITDRRHHLKDFRAQAGLFEVFFSAVVTALFSRNRVPSYAVTDKVPNHPSLVERLHHVLPHLAIIALNIGAIIYGYLHGESRTAFFWVNTVWALWVIWLLWPFTVLALREPPEKAPR